MLIRGVFKVIKAWRKAVIRDWGWDPVNKFNESPANMELEFFNGSTIVFSSAADMDEVRGGSYGYAAFDEADYIVANADAWAAFLPCMRGYGPGRKVIGGTPSSLGSGLMALVLALSSVDNNVSVHRACTLDNPYFSARTLALMRATLTADDWAREVEGREVARSGLVYPEFTDDNIIDFEIHAAFKKPNHSWRTFILIDWGYTLSHALFVCARQKTKHEPPEVIVYRDIPFDRADPAYIARECVRLSRSDPTLASAMICDPEGKRVEIPLAKPIFAQAHIPIVYTEAKQFRSIRQTVQFVRRALLTAHGHRSLFVTRDVARQTCNAQGGRGIVISFRSYSLEELGRGSGNFTDKPIDDNKSTHSMDCIRYFYINLGKIGMRWPWAFEQTSDGRMMTDGKYMSYRRANGI